MSKPIKESASFKIVYGDNAVSFKVEGSTVAALVEAFSWLPPERRLKVLDRLQVKQAKLLEAEAARAASAPTEGTKAQGADTQEQT